jgi:IS30 family transposase
MSWTKKIREIERKLDLLRKALFASEAEELREAFATGLLNNRPRKVLKYKTPFKVFFGLHAFATQNCTDVAFHL